MTTPATPPLSGPIPPTAPSEPDIVDQVRALNPTQQQQLFTQMSPEMRTNFSAALDRKLQAQKFQSVPTSQDPILQQNPGNAAPSGGPLPGAVRTAAHLLPSVTGTLGGIGGSMAGGALGTAVAPGAGTVAGSVAGGLAGSAAGGAVGKIGENEVLNQAFGEETPASQGVAKEGLAQAAYELVGRAVGGVLGRVARPLLSKIPGQLGEALAPTAPQTAETIAGVDIPQTAGQAWGKPGGFMQGVERYLGHSYLGGPLREVQGAQEAASREVLANLSKVSSPTTDALAENWQRAREVTRSTASPIYSALGNVPVPKAAQVAQDMLDNPDLANLLPKSAKDALTNVTSSGFSPAIESMARNQGYKNATEMSKNFPGFDGLAKSIDPSYVPGGGTATFQDALDARHAIGDALSKTGRGNERRILGQAYQDINSTMDSALNPQQLALKQNADLLWRRSYIMDNVAKSLTKIERTQPVGEPQTVIPQAFIKTVNDLAKQDVSRNGAGQIFKKASQLDILYDDPQDKQDMIKLANFLSTKYSHLAGSSGVGGMLANIGMIGTTLHMGAEALTGNFHAAAAEGLSLGGTYLLSRALANPGGPALVMKYFASGGATAAAAATKIAMAGLSEYTDNKDKSPAEQRANQQAVIQANTPPPPAPPEHVAIANQAKQAQGIQ